MKDMPEIKSYFGTIEIDKSPHTYRSYYTSIDRFFAFMNIQDFEGVKKVSNLDIRNYQKYLKNCGLQEPSINTNIRPIRAMYNWLIENEYLTKTPMTAVKDLKCAKKEITFLTEEEQRKIIENCDTILDKVIMAMILSTGMRRDEFCKLKISDYNGTHILIHGKGNKERKLALQPALIQLLNEYIGYRINKYGNKDDALIVSKYGKAFTGDGIYERVKVILAKAGLEQDRIDEIHPHTLRHSFVANMLESGADIFVCQIALGHASLKTTMRYSHLHASTLDRALQNQKSIL